jgi:hypothetical protein
LIKIGENNMNVQHLRRWTLMATMLLTCFLMTGMALAQMVTTDKADYAPEETVIITGSGFSSTTDYAVPVVRPDNSIVKGDGSFTPGWDIVTTDGSGGFIYSYKLDGILGTYDVRVYASEWSVILNEDPVASTKFTDAAAHNVNFATSGLPGGISITVSWSKTNPAGHSASGSTAFNSPGPSGNEGTMPSTTFTYSGFPSSVTVGGATYNFVSASPASTLFQK